MIKYFILLIIICLTCLGFADVIVPAGPVTDTLWTKANSPYRINGNITIDSLRIEPGVEVLFQDNYRFEVNGILIANGFYSDSILFKSYYTNTNGWQGILFDDCIEESELSYCMIDSANNDGIRINDCIAPRLNNVLFRNNLGDGLYLRRSNISINNCIFKNNSSNGIRIDNGVLDIRNSVLSENSEAGIFSENGQDSVFVTNCVVSNNSGTGLQTVTGYFEVINSIVYYNNIDISIPPTNRIINYSCFGGVVAGTGNITDDPDFVDHINYFLNITSPCRDAGNDQSIFNDLFFPPSLKTFRNDMGAYGGSLAGNWFPAIYLQPDSLFFGQVSYDSSSTQTIKVKNYRNISINVDNIKVSGNDSISFRVNPSFLNMGVMDSAYLDITFTPNDQRLFSSNIELNTIEYGKFYLPVYGEGIFSEISTIPNTLDFGNVELGASLDSVINIYNAGMDTLRIFNIFSANSEFSINKNSLNIDPMSFDSLEVTFTPISIDNIIDSLTILNNDPDEGIYTIDLSGQGFGPIFNVDTTDYNFGSVLLTTDTTLNVTINNFGNGSLSIDSIHFFDNNLNTFGFRDDSLEFPINIDAGNNFLLAIDFEPNSMGIDSAGLVIESNDPFNPVINLSFIGYGVSPVFGLDTSMIDFGVIPFNTKAADSILITNSGNISLHINPDSLMFTGIYPEIFVIDSVESFEIAANESIYVYISFYTIVEGIHNTNLHILTNDPINPKKSIEIHGECYLPQIVNPSGFIDFGNVLKDSVEFVTTYLYNVGIGDLVIFKDSLFIDGPDANHFSVDSLEKYKILNGDSAFIRIRFEAQKPALNSAVLNIFNNDPDSHLVSIDLEAFVLIPFIHLPQSTIEFGTIPLGSKIQKSMVIKNNGYDNLTLYPDSLELIGDEASFFNIDSIPSDSIIQPGDSINIILGYNANEAGIKTASLIIRSDDQVLPQIPVSLSGSSAAPQIVLSNESINFGAVPALTNTIHKLEIINIGLGDLTIYKKSFSIIGTDSISFTILNNPDSNITIIPQDTFYVDIRLNTEHPGPKNAHLNLNSNDINDPNIIINLQGLIIDNMPASIVIDTQHSNSELKDKENGNLRFNISTNFPTDSVLLFHRQGGKTNFTTTHCENLTQVELWEITIDTSWFSGSGFEYFVRVFHGWTFSDWPNKPKSMQVNFELVEFPELTRLNKYQKISIPFNTNNQSLNTLFRDNLGNIDNTNYRIYDCENGIDYNEITNLILEQLPPGKSIWLITKEKLRLDFRNAKTLPTDTTFQLQLYAGWNMISNPFDFPIDWSENDDIHPVRYYNNDGDWPFVTKLEPYKGYAVKVKNDTTVFIQPNEYTGTTTLTKAPLFKDFNWTINLKAEQNNLKDQFNFVGTKNNASEGIDIFDYPEPPSIGNYVGLYFTQENLRNGKVEKFSTNIKSESNDGYIYDFEVVGNVPGKKKLMLEANSIPKDYQFVVVNKKSKIKYSSNEIDLYSDTNTLQLIVGFEEFVSSHTAEYNFVPSAFRLEQNFPNPFNPSTTISFELPEYSKLSINVYNILGQKVKTLLKNVEKEAGYYHIKWDGRNDSGNSVATGLYILNFHSDGFTKSIKMVFQR